MEEEGGKMNIEPCFLCREEAIVERIIADKYDVRCEKCGKYIFYNGLNEDQYKHLSEEEIEKISNYVNDYNVATNEFAEVGDIEELWIKIESFYRRT